MLRYFATGTLVLLLCGTVLPTTYADEGSARADLHTDEVQYVRTLAGGVCAEPGDHGVVLTVTVTNSGDAAAPASETAVSVYDLTGTCTRVFHTPALEPGERVTHSAMYAVSIVAPEWYYSVEVDRHGQVDESDESNNEAWGMARGLLLQAL